jgi:diguanylate cyclase (GGDEF)-like protein
MNEVDLLDSSRERRDTALIRQAASLFAADVTLDDLFERLTGLLAAHVDASVVFVALTDAAGNAAIHFIFDHGAIDRDVNIPLTERSRARAAIESGETIWGNSTAEWAPDGASPIHVERPETNDSVSAIFVPMRVGGRNVGALSVQTTRPGAYDAENVELVAAIAHFLGVAIENNRLVARLTRSAEFDTLTGLANHSRLVRSIDRAIDAATSTRPAALVMFNLTNFGSFNDTYGYAQGDAILQRVARSLEELGGDDVTIGRFGGDVFLALIQGHAREFALDVIANAMERLRGLSYVAGGAIIPISIACGYAFVPLEAAGRTDAVALCVHRARLSRKLGGMPIGEDDIDSYHLHGVFDGIETVVGSLLDRDPFTRVHLFHVNAMAKHWSEYNLDLDAGQLAWLLQASLLHDVGKLLIPDNILIKPGALTAAEYRAMQEHADFGRTILLPYAAFADVAEIVGQHHERWDGAGYPNGLRGEQIRPLARAIAILDAFSAMVVDRPYHRGIPESEALAEIERCSGTQFDPEYVERFVAWRRGAAARVA